MGDRTYRPAVQHRAHLCPAATTCSSSVITLAAAFLRLWQLAAVPPGLHYDLAATALLGNEVAFHGYRPIFISAYTGHEALYYYWLALWFRLAGSSVFTLRLAAAMLGILAVPAGFFAMREAMRFEQEVALPLAGAGGGLPGHGVFPCGVFALGFRVIIEPVVQALALGFCSAGCGHQPACGPVLDRAAAQPGWRGQLWRKSTLYLVLAGLFTGLAAYTYLAARLFPAPLAVFWAALLGGVRRSRRAGRHAARELAFGCILFGAGGAGGLCAAGRLLFAAPARLPQSGRRSWPRGRARRRCCSSGVQRARRNAVP